MIDNNLIDRSVLGMCLFGIWADVHEVGSLAKIFYWTSAFYTFTALIGILLLIVKAYYDFKLNRMKK